MYESDGRCHVHPFEPAGARCRDCGHEFCGECLVYAFGPGRPPFCVPCALAAAGVRANAARQPAMSRRRIRRMERERRRAERRRAPGEAPAAGEEPGPETATGPVPAPAVEDPFAWADDPDLGQRVPY